MKKAILAVAVIAILTIGVLLLVKAVRPTSSSNQNPTTDQTGQANQVANCPPPPAKTLSYCNGSFNSLTVSAGDQVTFRNDGTSVVDIDSDPHPAHTDEPELNVGRIQPGQTKTVTVTHKGTWGIHNHLRASEQASLTIQ